MDRNTGEHIFHFDAVSHKAHPAQVGIPFVSGQGNTNSCSQCHSVVVDILFLERLKDNSDSERRLNA